MLMARRLLKSKAMGEFALDGPQIENPFLDARQLR
jgi:hypothetical protein